MRVHVYTSYGDRLMCMPSLKLAVDWHLLVKGMNSEDHGTRAIV